MKIIIDDLSSPVVIRFLNDHLRHMIEVTPPGCVHALDIEALKKPEITFWTAWEGAVLICCGALKRLNANEAELKSMRTAPTHLGQGAASYLLQHILTAAKKLRYQRIYLETGSSKAFEPARRLYEKFGFEYGAPFSDYVKNANSVYLSMEI